MLICHGILAGPDAHVAALIAPAIPTGRLVIALSGRLAALATQVPDDISLEALLATSDGVARLAVEHNRILTEFARAADILPLRLDSFHSDEAALIAMLQREGERLAAGLQRIEGCVEFVVKIEATGRPVVAAADQPATGRDYLAARLKVRDRAAAQRAETARILDDVSSRLAGHSRAAMVATRPAQSGAVRHLKTTTHLVERANQSGFAAAVEASAGAMAEQGIALVASGPWPPYQFSQVSEENHARSD